METFIQDIGRHGPEVQKDSTLTRIDFHKGVQDEEEDKQCHPPRDKPHALAGLRNFSFQFEFLHDDLLSGNGKVNAKFPDETVNDPSHRTNHMGLGKREQDRGRFLRESPPSPTSR
jgi:hypothetical protein